MWFYLDLSSILLSFSAFNFNGEGVEPVGEESGEQRKWDEGYTDTQVILTHR